MAKKEWYVEMAMVIIGGTFVIESMRLGLGSGHRPGMGFLPFFTGIALCLLALFRIVKNPPRRGEESGRREPFGWGVLKVAVLVIALMGYSFVLPHIGYLLSTFILLVFLFKIGGFRKWIVALGSAFVATSISYIMFSSWLNIRFPKGFLGF